MGVKEGDEGRLRARGEGGEEAVEGGEDAVFILVRAALAAEGPGDVFGPVAEGVADGGAFATKMEEPFIDRAAMAFKEADVVLDRCKVIVVSVLGGPARSAGFAVGSRIWRARLD